MSLARSLSGAFGAACAIAALAAPAQAAETPAPGFHPLIIDGRVAEEGPWAARLLQGDQEACTSTVVAPNWILTAQHCVEGAGDTLNFNIGSLNQHEGENFKAKQGGVHVHDTADLALVELERPTQATPSPLGTDGAVENGQTVQTYGWGATTTDGNEGDNQSPVLKVADVTVTNVNGQDYRGGVAVEASRGDGIPAGGDSGGPMFAKSAVDGKYVQVGVASTSDRQSVTAYTKVTEYRDWIKSVAGV